MPKKAKKLEEIHDFFEENEIDYTVFDNIAIMKELTDKIKSVNDVRHQSYISHNLVDIIMLTLLAVLANANEWVEIEEFGKIKEDWLRKFLELPNGIPSDDTIRIAISNLDSRYFYSLVVDFLLNKLNDIINVIEKEDNGQKEKEILSMDGKTS